MAEWVNTYPTSLRTEFSSLEPSLIKGQTLLLLGVRRQAQETPETHGLVHHTQC